MNMVMTSIRSKDFHNVQPHIPLLLKRTLWLATTWKTEFTFQGTGCKVLLTPHTYCPHSPAPFLHAASLRTTGSFGKVDDKLALKNGLTYIVFKTAHFSSALENQNEY